MVVPDKFPQIGRAQVVPLFAEGVLKIEMIQAELVGHDDIPVIGHPAGDPVMAADGFHPPDLVLVGKGDAIVFIGAVLLQKGAQPLHALPGAADVGQYDADQILLTDAAGNVLSPGGGFGLEADHGVSGENTGVGGDGLRGSHGYIGGVDAVGGPDAVGQVYAGGGGIAQGILRQTDLQMADLALVFFRLILGQHHYQLFLVKESVVVPGNHGRAVEACLFAHQNRCTRHNVSSFLIFCFCPGQTARASFSFVVIGFIKLIVKLEFDASL